jgi:hypothetical protein
MPIELGESQCSDQVHDLGKLGTVAVCANEVELHVGSEIRGLIGRERP